MEAPNSPGGGSTLYGSTPSNPPLAASCQSGLISKTAPINVSYIQNPAFPSSNAPLMCPPGSHGRQPDLTYSPRTPHHRVTHFDSNFTLGSNTSRAQYNSADLSQLGSSRHCPYPMPTAVNYSTQSGHNQYIGQTLEHSSLSTPHYHASPQYNLTPRPPNSQFSVASNHHGERYAQRKTKMRVARRFDEGMHTSLRDVVPCMSNWLQHVSESFRKWDTNKMGQSRIYVISSTIVENTRAFIEGFLSGEEPVRRRPSATGKRGYNEGYNQGCLTACRESSAAPLPHNEQPCVEAVCLQCGSSLQSNPSYIDDDKLQRVLKTEIAKQKAVAASKGEDIVALVHNRPSESGRIPLPRFDLSLALQEKSRYELPSEITQRKKVGAGSFEYKGVTHPADESGKVALPQFPLPVVEDSAAY